MVARIVFLICAVLLRLAAGAGLSENKIERQQAVSCFHEWIEAWNSHDLRAGVRSITIYYRSVGRRVAEVRQFNARGEIARAATQYAVTRPESTAAASVRASGDDQVRKPRSRSVANQCSVRQLMSVLSEGRRPQ
jgi:hypothetical protein